MANRSGARRASKRDSVGGTKHADEGVAGTRNSGRTTVRTGIVARGDGGDEEGGAPTVGAGTPAAGCGHRWSTAVWLGRRQSPPEIPSGRPRAAAPPVSGRGAQRVTQLPRAASVGALQERSTRASRGRNWRIQSSAVTRLAHAGVRAPAQWGTPTCSASAAAAWRAPRVTRTAACPAGCRGARTGVWCAPRHPPPDAVSRCPAGKKKQEKMHRRVREEPDARHRRGPSQAGRGSRRGGWPAARGHPRSAGAASAGPRAPLPRCVGRVCGSHPSPGQTAGAVAGRVTKSGQRPQAPPGARPTGAVTASAAQPGHKTACWGPAGPPRGNSVYTSNNDASGAAPVGRQGVRQCPVSCAVHVQTPFPAARQQPNRGTAGWVTGRPPPPASVGVTTPPRRRDLRCGAVTAGKARPAVPASGLIWTARASSRFPRASCGGGADAPSALCPSGRGGQAPATVSPSPVGRGVARTSVSAAARSRQTLVD